MVERKKPILIRFERRFSLRQWAGAIESGADWYAGRGVPTFFSPDWLGWKVLRRPPDSSDWARSVGPRPAGFLLWVGRGKSGRETAAPAGDFQVLGFFQAEKATVQSHVITPDFYAREPKKISQKLVQRHCRNSKMLYRFSSQEFLFLVFCFVLFF